MCLHWKRLLLHCIGRRHGRCRVICNVRIWGNKRKKVIGSRLGLKMNRFPLIEIFLVRNGPRCVFVWLRVFQHSLRWRSGRPAGRWRPCWKTLSGWPCPLDVFPVWQDNVSDGCSAPGGCMDGWMGGSEWRSEQRQNVGANDDGVRRKPPSSPAPLRTIDSSNGPTSHLVRARRNYRLPGLSCEYLSIWQDAVGANLEREGGKSMGRKNGGKFEHGTCYSGAIEE